MTNATNTNTDLTSGTPVQDTKHPERGILLVAGSERGWVRLLAEDGTEHKARAAWLALVAPEGEETEAEAVERRRMSRVLREARKHYVATIAPSGRKSASNGDAVALFLEGKDADDVVVLAEQLLGLEQGELVERYAKLNPGQRRMNAGNRIRAALKRGDLTEEQLEG
jgi:hypothetical protein